MRYILDAQRVNAFRYCPFCGEPSIHVYDGDYDGQVQCLDCDEELEFTILEEYRDRYPLKFKKLIYGYTKVQATDWLGMDGVFQVIRLVKRNETQYSCTFKNSIGDHEIILVDEKDLLP